MINFGAFWKTEACGQIVLPYRSLSIGQKMMENAKLENYKCDFWGDFQTLWKMSQLSFFRMLWSFDIWSILNQTLCFFSADWLHDYRLHGMGSIHFCDSQSVPGRNFGKISKWPYVMSYHMLKYLHFSDIYLRRHWIGFHPLLFGVDWMGWWGLGKSLPSQTFFVLRCGIHDCGNWRNYFTQHCEIRGTHC